MQNQVSCRETQKRPDIFKASKTSPTQVLPWRPARSWSSLPGTEPQDALPFLILHSLLHLAKDLNLTTTVKKKGLHSTIKYTNHEMYTTNKNSFSTIWWEEFCVAFFFFSFSVIRHFSNVKPLFKVENHFSISGNIVTSCQKSIHIIRTISNAEHLHFYR